MATTNVWAGDLALVEIHNNGSTGAPPEVLRKLAELGHLKAESPTLTAAGRERAEKLKDGEQNLRMMFAASIAGGATMRMVGGTALTTNGGGSSLQLGGGKPVEFHFD